MDRIDIDIVDGSHKGNVYLSKKVCKGSNAYLVLLEKLTNAPGGDWVGRAEYQGGDEVGDYDA